MRYVFVCCLCLCVMLCFSVFVLFGCDSSCEVVCEFCVYACLIVFVCYVVLNACGLWLIVCVLCVVCLCVVCVCVFVG